MTPAFAAMLLPQLRQMVAELEQRPNVPPRVAVAAKEFVAALEAWISGGS